MGLYLTLDFYYYMCFPSDTYVLTENGRVSIQDIVVGDKILAYNFENNAP